MILAIETSTLTGSVALLSGGKLLGETTLSVSVQHSERLMPAIDQLFRDAAVSPKDVDLYAVAEGPGSFTGLRIGIAAAQGLSLAHGKPLVGVSTLQGLAMNAGFFPGPIVPVLNAFRSELYFGIYRFEDGAPRAIQEDGVASVDEFLHHVSSLGGESLLLGNGLEICGPKISDSSKIRAVPDLLNTPRASNIAYLAGRRKEAPESHPVLPRYLRKPG